MPKLEPTSAQFQEILAYIEQETERALVASLSAMLDDESLQAETASEQGAVDGLLWYQQEFHFPETSQLFLGLERGTALAIGHKLLAASGLEEEDDETALGTFQEILGQVSGALASSFSARLKREITAGPLSEQAPDSGVVNSISLKVTSSSEELGTVVVYPMPGLLNAFLEKPAEEEQKLPAVVPAAPSAVLPNTRNLDLLLDVEMPVSVSFGKAQLPLKDVIKLTTGSIVELDRTVSEPVEIIVNNAVIAQGEVVIVDGNFGVRIIQILSKQDRLRSLG